MKSWSIIVFCYNEEGNIIQVIDAVKKISLMHKNNIEIIVVDDGSTDGSREKIELQNGITIKCHTSNLGIGEALKSGYALAQNELVCAVPADGQFDVNELIPHLNLPDNEVLSFFRKENSYYSGFRNLLSFVNKFFNRYLIGLTLIDVNWVKVYPLKDLRAIEIKLNSSLRESEICAKLAKNQVVFKQVESKYYERKTGIEKGHSWKIVVQAMREMIKLYWTVKKHKSNKVL